LRRSTRLAIVLGALILPGVAAPAEPATRRWQFGLRLGYGALELAADQAPSRRLDTFAMSFDAGCDVTRHLYLGATLGGWLIEAYDWQDPAAGESVSQLLAVARLRPWAARGWFVQAGAGRATYTNHHPYASGGSGWGRTLGAGCVCPVATGLCLVPQVSFGGGGFGDVARPVAPVSGRRFEVWELAVALAWGR
jgi:hypothetical protein